MGWRSPAGTPDWIRSRLESVPARVPFAQDAAIPVHGRTRVVRHAATERAGVREHGEMLAVGGAAKNVARQIETWLRGEARRVVTALAHAKAGNSAARSAASPFAMPARAGCADTGASSFATADLHR